MKTNLKLSALAALALWILMTGSVALHEWNLATTLIGAVICLIIAIIAGIVLFIGLLVQEPLHNWWKANEKRYRQRKGLE